MAEREAALTPYRVLDLTTERGFLCGKIFADLGAEVIKIEPPEGDCGRDIGPFYKDIADRENSLFWFAFNTGKKSITLDIETTDGQQMLKKLVKTADFLIESFDPGYLDGLGIGYSALSETNPRLMMGSISPFGQKGPYSQWKGPDIVPWAMSGYMWMTGEPESAPLRISSPPQTYLHASAMTVVGLLMALRYREMSGEGQYIDTSAQQCPTWMLTHTYAYWDLLQVNLGRAGTLRQFGERFIRTVWPCKDGYIVLMAAGGPIGAKGQRRLIEMLEEEGIAEDLLEDIRVAESSVPGDNQEDIDRDRADRLERAQRLREAFGQLFTRKTKAELLNEAVAGDFMLAPVSTVADLMENPQLKDRDYWVEVEHPELGATITYPGAPCKLTETPWQIKGRAPLIGEHNNEIYQKDPGLSEEGNDQSAKRWNSPMGERVEDKLPLDGVKVLDFTTTVLGPTVTRYLAEHGATVVRVESASHPETTRTATPHAEREPGIDRSGYFATHNADKLSLSLDMGKAEAIVVARKLVEWADIVVETFTPSIMARWGLNYEELRKIKPDIIMASSCLQGQTGPYASHRGYGQISAAMTGWYELTGWPDGEPIGPYSAYSDFIGWNYLLISILAALDYRSRTGKGQYIDHSHIESGIHFLSPALLDYTINGRAATRMANRDPYAAPHGAYRCQGEDKWCVIAVTNDEEWQAFGKVLGNPNWIKDPRFATDTTRKENEDELDRLVEKWTINHAAEEVMVLMQQAGVPAGLVENAEDLFNDPQLKYRQAFVALDHSEIGTYQISSPVFKSSKFSNEPRSPAPLMGEHNEYILKEFLGMSDDEIADLLVAEALQ